MKLKVIGFILTAAVIFFISCQSEEKIEFNRYYSAGALLYQQHCENCHGKHGEGLVQMIPPLNDSIYVKTNKNRLACYVRYGLKGPITINGTPVDGNMIASNLSPIEIAEVLTYVGNSFGNKLSTINEQEVQSDLADCR